MSFAYKCDKCGEFTEEASYKIRVQVDSVFITMEFFSNSSDEAERFDICFECQQKILDDLGRNAWFYQFKTKRRDCRCLGIAQKVLEDA